MSPPGLNQSTSPHGLNQKMSPPDPRRTMSVLVVCYCPQYCHLPDYPHFDFQCETIPLCPTVWPCHRLTRWSPALTHSRDCAGEVLYPLHRVDAPLFFVCFRRELPLLSRRAG
eukprot:3937125-Rhodomonas_salina.1